MANLHVIAGSSLCSAKPVVRKIGLSDLKDALAKGLGDLARRLPQVVEDWEVVH